MTGCLSVALSTVSRVPRACTAPWGVRRPPWLDPGVELGQWASCPRRSWRRSQTSTAHSVLTRPQDDLASWAVMHSHPEGDQSLLRLAQHAGSPLRTSLASAHEQLPKSAQRMVPPAGAPLRLE